VPVGLADADGEGETLEDDEGDPVSVGVYSTTVFVGVGVYSAVSVKDNEGDSVEDNEGDSVEDNEGDSVEGNEGDSVEDNEGDSVEDTEGDPVSVGV
jgi:hypothetical protein